MTIEDKIFIEEARNTTDYNIALKLVNISLSNNGPDKVGCFCKTANITRFITNFYNWYDNIQKD